MFSRARPVLLVCVVAAAGAGLTATPAVAATATACQEATIEARVTERDPDLAETVQAEDALDVVCRDLNGDGRKDALFSVNGGGTGQAFQAGIVRGRGSAAPRLDVWVHGNAKTAIGFRKRRPAIANPRFRDGEPSCCPTGGWTVRRYGYRDGRFRLVSHGRLSSDAFPLRRTP